jgi:hypothetical protein
MQGSLFTTVNMNRRKHWLSPLLVFVLLWGTMAFAVHTHHHDDHDELPTGDSECQLCLFASISSAAVAHANPELIRIVSLVSVSELITESVFISLHLHSQQPRAPPTIS